MRTISILLGCLALAGCGGGDGQSLVVVSVTADHPLAGASTLNITATVGGKSATFPVGPKGSNVMLANGSSVSFGIDIPKGMSGAIHLVGDAVDAGGKTLAHGSADGTIKPGASSDVSLVLAVVGQPSGGDMGMSEGGLHAERATQAFGSLTINKTSPSIDIAITNGGVTESAAPSFATSGDNVDQFTIVNHCTAPLGSGDSCSVSVAFAPTTAGQKSARVTLSDLASLVTLDLTGEGTPPGQLTINADAPISGDCGAAPIGTASATKATYTVKNTGKDATGAVTPSTSDPQFVASGCGAALAPNQSCTVTVVFTPTKRNKQVASVEVKATPNLQAGDSAQGVGQLPAVFTIATTDTGTAPRGGSATAVNVTAKNTGDLASDALGDSTKGGADAASFTIASDGCKGQRVAPNATCTVSVQLTPARSGSLSATLNVNLNGASVGSGTITGTGTPAWTQEATNLTDLGALNAVAGTSTNRIYAVGAGDSASNTFHTVAVRDNKGVWTDGEDVNTNIPLISLSIAGPTSLYMSDTSLVYSSNGNGTWSGNLSTNSPRSNIAGVYAFSDADVWSASGTQGGFGWTLYHYTVANGWDTSETLPNSASTALNNSGKPFWGTSSTDLFALGTTLDGILESPTIFHRTGTGWKTVFVGNQTAALSGGYHAWVSSMIGFGTPTNRAFAAIYNEAPNVGSTPPVQMDANGAWTAMAGVPDTVYLCSAVWGASATQLWFACRNGIFFTDGTSWADPFAPAGVIFKGLWGDSASNVYAVGQDANKKGVVYHLF